MAANGNLRIFALQSSTMVITRIVTSSWQARAVESLRCATSIGGKCVEQVAIQIFSASIMLTITGGLVSLDEVAGFLRISIGINQEESSLRRATVIGCVKKSGSVRRLS